MFQHLNGMKGTAGLEGTHMLHDFILEVESKEKLRGLAAAGRNQLTPSKDQRGKTYSSRLSKVNHLSNCF